MGHVRGESAESTPAHSRALDRIADDDERNAFLETQGSDLQESILFCN